MGVTSDSKKKKSAVGWFGKFLIFIILLGSVGIGISCFFIIQPQDISDLRSVKNIPNRDLKVVIQNSLDRGYPITLSEAELNQWLARNLTTKQAGLLESHVILERLWVRLDEGFAELILERKIMGRPFTVSMFLMIDKTAGSGAVQTEIQLHGGPYHSTVPFPNRGGRFGKLVVPQGFLRLVLPAFEKLGILFYDEIELAINRMSHVKIEKNQLILDPRDSSDASLALPQGY